MDVGLTAVVQCDGDACQQMRAVLPKITPDPFERAWSFKYNLDMDGNSYSQRLKSLLASNSLLFKHRPLFPEFWQVRCARVAVHACTSRRNRRTG